MQLLSRIGLIVLTVLLTACGVGKEETSKTLPEPDLSTGKHYANTAWATVHRDSRNSDYTPFFVSANLRVKWEALDGAAIAIGPTIGPEGNIYITTGQGTGKSHFHVFNREGKVLWESAPQQTLDDLDYAAFMNAAAVDINGDVYVGDLNQLWAFHPDGTVKWVASVSAQGATGYIVTPIFSKEGHVGGITTDGKVIFFNRQSGVLAWPVLDLPGRGGPPGKPAPVGFMGGGLLEKKFIQPLWDLIWGWEIEVANTPAVHPETGRIYITAAGATPNTGVLYGIDTGPEALSISFSAPMGAGSGTSPALSLDGSFVCAADEAGIMYGVDAESGKVLWKATGTIAGASPAVGPDGTVYSYSEGNIAAINGADGSLRWKVNYDSLAAEHLRESRLASRIARVDTIITVSAAKVWAAIDMDYGFMIGNQLVPLPQMTLVTAVDPADGRVINTTPVRDTCGAFITPTPDGTVYVSLGAFASSAQYFSLNQALPEELRVPGPLKAGLVAFEPAFAAGHARGAIRWVIELIDEARRDSSEGNPASAIINLERSRAQLRGTQLTLEDAVTRGELDRATADDCRANLVQAEASIYDVVSLLREGKVDISDKLQKAGNLMEDVISRLVDVPEPEKMKKRGI
jgi:outer membrane protein assembly factor BamB